MKNWKLCLCLFILNSSFVVGVKAQSDFNIAGKWNGTVEVPLNDID